jgi:hypothetical protein
MTKKLLFLLDTDPVPSVFDTVVGYDGGADHVIGYGGVTPENAGALVDGAIYTRGPKEKQYTALFVGGGSMVAGEALFKAVKKRFFANFRVSVMLDSNGSNTTAAAGVALLAKAKPLAGKKAIVLAGTGPVGMRAAAMLHIEGANAPRPRAGPSTIASALRPQPLRPRTIKPLRRRSRERISSSRQARSGSSCLMRRIGKTIQRLSSLPIATRSRRSASGVSKPLTRRKSATARS